VIGAWLRERSRMRARRRRMRAAEELQTFWRYWFIFFWLLHKETPPGPAALQEYQFSEVVYFHERLVR